MKLQNVFQHNLTGAKRVFTAKAMVRFFTGSTTACAFIIMAGCSTASFDNAVSNSAALTKQMTQQVLSKVVADDYQVTRTRHYPLSTHAPIYVDGKDDMLVQQFSSALRHHFRSVADGVSTPDAKPHTGFILKVERLDNPPALSTNSTANKHSTDTENPTVSTASENDAARKFRVTVSDIDKGEAFDSINIQLRSPSLWREADSAVLLDRALMSAAAKLAGKS
jgi:hypothetical protein